MDTTQAGYREIEHTADWALEVWAPDLTALFVQAARGMYELSGAELQPASRTIRQIDLTAPDEEGLLVSFLSELLFFGEQEDLGFDSFDLTLEDGHLSATVEGAPFATRNKEIKAVTYNDLEIKQTARGFEVQIVFDV